MVFVYNPIIMEKQTTIRVKVLAWLQQDDHLFVVKMHDCRKCDDYYRPVGGSVEFGETTREALLREVHEELNTRIRITGEPLIVENLFTCDGEQGHEIDYVYPAQFIDPVFHLPQVYPLIEASGERYEAMWIALPKFLDGRLRLVPEALLEWYRS